MPRPASTATSSGTNSCDDQYLSGVVSFINFSSPRISNNIFEHNPCRAINMTLPTGTSPNAVHNTIVDNQVGVRVDARVKTETQIYRNNILVGNDIGLQVDFGTPSQNPTWEYNLVFGNGTDYVGIDDQTGISGNISVAPLFRNPAHDDFRLRPGSPAVDAGTVIPGLNHDFARNPRPVDGNGNGTAEFDMGAYELQPPSTKA